MTWLADVVLAAVALEAVLLLLFGRHLGRGLGRGDAIGMLLPGVGLTVAVRLALGGSGLKPIALALLLAGMAHVHDVMRRVS